MLKDNFNNSAKNFLNYFQTSFASVVLVMMGWRVHETSSYAPCLVWSLMMFVVTGWCLPPLRQPHRVYHQRQRPTVCSNNPPASCLAPSRGLPEDGGPPLPTTSDWPTWPAEFCADSFYFTRIVYFSILLSCVVVIWAVAFYCSCFMIDTNAELLSFFLHRGCYLVDRIYFFPFYLIQSFLH